MEQIPFLSKSTIQRTILKLEDNGYLHSDNFNKLKIDKTKWYTILYENIEKLKIDKMTDDHAIVAEEPSSSDHPEQVEYSEWTDEMVDMECPSSKIGTQRNSI
ncbi:hypothetical protein [Bacillus sp. REN16]|uniref:hypothetical protein n=1 Tax=Bacillus sp. REN16 TaxID=2887296 RepID=UPI001E490260|nr:hypothetical protein [Bacillus sp. REN16]MCC3359150.1 hypothetical protein [Bacillus sp. REN16]